MSYNFSTVAKTVSVRKRTDGSQNYKNVAQAEAILSNAEVNKEKLKLAQLSAEDKHEMHKTKFARESIKLEQEAKEYWNSLSEEEKKQIAGQMFVENQAQLRAYRDKNDVILDKELMNLKWSGREYRNSQIHDKLSNVVRIVLTVMLVTFLCMVFVMMVAGFMKTLA